MAYRKFQTIRLSRSSLEMIDRSELYEFSQKYNNGGNKNG